MRADRSAIATLMLVSATLIGCSDSAETTEERPAGAVGDASPVAEDCPTTLPSENQTPTQADIDAYLDCEAVEGLALPQELVTDVDGDARSDVIVAGIDEDGAVLRVASWTNGAFEVLATERAGDGAEVTGLREADLQGDGPPELVVTTVGEGAVSVAVWTVRSRGNVVPLDAVGGCYDGSNVYGSTVATIEGQGGDSVAIVADCPDASEEERWVWTDGAFTLEE